MAPFRYALRLLCSSSESPLLSTRRLLNYSAICYDGKEDPAPKFFNEDVQSLLKSLTRADYSKVFRKRKIGTERLTNPRYQFMTDAELQEALKKASRKADELLQIPPVVKVRDPTRKVYSKDTALQGLFTEGAKSPRLVFTDITYGIKDSERLIVVREPDGTLQEAELELRQRINQVYFPRDGKLIKSPRMFEGAYFEALLDKHEYEYILDRACIQFDPEDPEYQRIVSITYQHLNESGKFECLRSTRHFGALTFFLIWNKNVDNLLLELIETLHVEEARKLVSLYSLVHEVHFEGGSDVEVIGDYIKKLANKKGALELAVQAYKDVAARQEQLKEGIRTAHGT